MFFRIKPSGRRSYVQIVENRWEDGKSRQKVLLTVGRLDELHESGQLDALLESGGRLAESLLVLSAHRRSETTLVATKRIGPVLVFERLWRQSGCQAIVEELAGERRFGFSLERAIFLTVLHRLMTSGSDRSAMRWKDSYRIDGVGPIALHQLYRAMAFLGDELPEDEQAGATPFSPRCVKDRLEEQIFLERRDLFTDLDLVFFDTTSIYFEGEGGETIGQRGHSKDHRPDLKQMIVGAVLDGDGRPVCCEMWPGNTTDVKSLIPVAERLKQRFGVSRVCVVADRGMISHETIEELERLKFDYILGARMRTWAEVRDDVLTRPGRYREIVPARTKTKDPSPLKVKEVLTDSGRFIVCLNEEQARKDAHDRQAILETLREKLSHGGKELVGNKGFRKYLKSEKAMFQIDANKVTQEARYDGKWVLATNTSLSAEDVAGKYKQLWMVEQVFRSMKSLLSTRPIFHKCDETIRGHVFCSFLALVLRKELQDRLLHVGIELEWEDLIRDLDALQEIDVSNGNGTLFRLRTTAQGCAGKVLKAVGVAMPATIRKVEGTTA